MPPAPARKAGSVVQRICVEELAVGQATRLRGYTASHRSVTDRTRLNLLGKDYLTEEEAAHYCGVSNCQFRRKHLELGVLAISVMGKKVYRRADLQRAIEREAARQHG